MSKSSPVSLELQDLFIVFSLLLLSLSTLHHLVIVAIKVRSFLGSLVGSFLPPITPPISVSASSAIGIPSSSNHCNSSLLLEELSLLFETKDIGRTFEVLESIGTGTKLPSGRPVVYRAAYGGSGMRSVTAGAEPGKVAVVAAHSTAIRIRHRTRTTSTVNSATGVTVSETTDIKDIFVKMEVISEGSDTEIMVDGMDGASGKEGLLATLVNGWHLPDQMLGETRHLALFGTPFSW
ncbi:hypothetical protein HDU93_008271 [Gonapodya sp. JEL0774]|nr:hypothetical protein HDU93_008271 [Gonapodya sp. JEL0774]